MKKITGKVVSLVLALALVVTSFSGTFAFAANKSETVVVTPDHDTLYLAAGDFTKDSNVTALLGGTAKTYDHQSVGVTVVEAARQSGNDLVKITNENNTVKFALKSATASGSEVIAVRYTGTLSTNRPETVTVNGIANITVKVLAKDALVMGNSGVTTGDGTTYPSAIKDFNKNEIGERAQDYSVYKVSQIANDIFPTYTAQDVVTDAKNVTKDNYLVSVNPEKFTLAVNAAAKTFKITSACYSNESYLRIGNVAVKAAKGAETAGTLSNAATDMVTSVAKVTNTVAIGGNTEIFQWHGATWAANKSVDEKTNSTLTDDVTKAYIPTTGAINISGADIAITKTTSMHSGSIGKVNGGAAFVMENGYVASVGGDVTTFTMTKGNVGKVEAKNVVINGGKTGDINASASIKVNATDELVPTIVGALKSADIAVGTTTAAAVTTGKITADSVKPVVISGTKTAIGAIDLNYYSTGAGVALDNFKGSIATPLNAKYGTISTSGTTDATIKGAIDIPNIMVGAGTTLRLHDAVRVESISGSGILEITAGKLYVKNSISGVSLKLANTFKVGDVIFSADAYKIYEGSFNTVGYTVEKVAGTTTDTFKVKTVDFANIQINKTSSKIALNYKETFTVSNYPVNTKLPEGYTIKWSFDGGDDYFNFTSKDNTATLEAKKFEKTFTSLNKGTLTATIYDQYGFQAYGYAPANCEVEIIEKPEVTSDTNNDFSVASGASYQFKITAAVQPTFTTGTAGVFKVELASHKGNDYFYKITATGKVGAATGIFINGNKLLVATVKAPAFTSDTKHDFTVKGAYQFKITAPATPTFAVGTAGVFKAEFVKKVGNDYFYKITSVGAAGAKAGIYVNGTKLLAATIG